jgi:hypothetical protein
MGFIESFQQGYSQEKYNQFKRSVANNQPAGHSSGGSRWLLILIVFLGSWVIMGGLINALFAGLGLYRLDATRTPAATLAQLGALGTALYAGFVVSRRRKVDSGVTRTSGQAVTETVFSIPTQQAGLPQLNITNPYRGVLVLGGAGSGKSKSVIETILLQAIQQGFTGLLYDFKFPALAQVANKAHRAFPSSVRPYYVNLEDLTRSHRVNPLRPDLMPTSSYADDYARCIMANLKPESIEKPDFWSDSAQRYLTAVIWFLREEYPQYCTLPHAMNLIFEPTADVVALLSTNPETRGTVASLREALQRKAEGQTAGVVSTLQTALGKINTKEICWVLSGDDFSLNLNDPKEPKFVTLGNSATLSPTFGPVLALLTSVALKQMNQRGKQKSVVILDEAPTLYIPGFEQLPATARDNGVATIFAAQDISQIEDMYGRNKKDALLANLNNQFFGRVGHRETAQYIVDLWGGHYVQQVTRSMGSGQTSNGGSVSDSTSVSEQRRNRIETQEVLDLEKGEFFGQLVESNVSSFKAKLTPYETGPIAEIVPFQIVTTQDVRENFARIQTDVQHILSQHREKVDSTQNPLLPPTHSNGQARHNGQARPGQSLNGESLDF